MGEGYYSGGFRKKRRRKRVPPSQHLLRSCDALFTVLAAVSSFLLLWAIISPAFRPTEDGIWSTVPLLYPLLYAAGFLSALYWITRWKVRHAAITLAFMVIASFPLGRYYSLPLRKQYPSGVKSRNRVDIMTFNVANRYTSPIVDYVSGSESGIVCLQELIFGADSRWDSLIDSYPYTTLHEPVRYANAIYSRYRILKDGPVDSLSRLKAVWADIAVHGDTVRVISLHLQHTAVGKADEEALYGMGPDQGDSIIRSVLRRISLNNTVRAREAETVSRFIGESPYRTIVCGDFNDVPLSYTYRTVSRGLNDAFRESGRGYSHTYDGFWNTLRIDYILLDPDILPDEYSVDNSVHYSDHYPVRVKLKI